MQAEKNLRRSLESSETRDNTQRRGRMTRKLANHVKDLLMRSRQSGHAILSQKGPASSDAFLFCNMHTIQII